MLTGTHNNAPREFDRAGCALVEDVLRGARTVRVRAQGSSMIPAIWPGDVLEIEPAGPASMTEGQIAVFIRDGRLFAHRIVQVGARELTTRGDSLLRCDAPLTSAELLGRVTFAMRGGRRIFLERAPEGAMRFISAALRSSNLLRRLVVGLHARIRRAQFAMRKALA
ncbi:MAG TPA: S24/S26 family peptidase [Candidatus Binataceae bacterium]|nr:S24/S26 family peptidase [Candidatus Binataceae bacterium]